MTAYASTAAGIVRWTEDAPGSAHWAGPELFPVEGLAGPVSFSQGVDRFVYFTALRRRRGGAAGMAGLEVVVSTQFQSGRPLIDWQCLGNPFSGGDEALDRLGNPSVAADAQGGLYVFLQFFGTGVRSRRRDLKGQWGAWEHMGGQWVRTPVAPVGTPAGSVHALAGYKGGALHWVRGAGEPGFRVFDRPAGDALPLTYTGRETGPGRVTYFWRDPSGTVVAHRPPGPGAGVPAVRALLGGEAGEGPVSTVRAAINGYDCTVMVQRGAGGVPEVAAYPTEQEGYGAWWAPLGEPGEGLPAVQVDADGRVVVAMVGHDGCLRVTRQNTAEPGLAFSAWRKIT
ncbi:hypothetical protein [Streptomyces sp. NPDC051567]|uniref:hypothetical protein n=1 Tax=Streptomyces sp. NPDC051567 TaxID=3365660 RepID=UPI0037AE114F